MLWIPGHRRNHHGTPAGSLFPFPRQGARQDLAIPTSRPGSAGDGAIAVGRKGWLHTGQAMPGEGLWARNREDILGRAETEPSVGKGRNRCQGTGQSLSLRRLRRAGGSAACRTLESGRARLRLAGTSWSCLFILFILLYYLFYFII